jgi:insertion element IS1 protein InsB
MRNCCPNCSSKAFVKNGITLHGAQNHLCKNCGRQFVLDPQSNRIPSFIRDLIDKLLLERLSLEGISRVTGVSMSWLLSYVSDLYSHVPDDLGVTIPSDVEGVILTRVEADELWSFVGSKENQQWVWLALDITTRSAHH